MNITQVVTALIGLLTTIITCVLVPWLKTKLNEEQQNMMKAIVRGAVYAAEQIYSATPQSGKEKKAFVIEFLRSKGYEIDKDELNIAIEAAVQELHLAMQ